MKISELILKLEDIKSTEGDLPVCLISEELSFEEDTYVRNEYTTLNNINVDYTLLHTSRYASELVKAVCLE